ncbi:MAG: DUF475 domain-containing protein [Bdellovibrionaceae bacterium]|nr:DUF475 domain-containing protein [Bdellovibrio sp.]
MLKYFYFPILSLVVGLAAAGLLSWSQHGNTTIVLQSVLTVLLLSLLEISLSFDNAVVNATVLKKMTPVWKKRFLTWGMLIAVFGMRLLFPVLIVAIVGNLSLFESFSTAFTRPEQYSKLMQSAHLSVSSFGGAFLLMVFLHFFLNEDKTVHWIKLLEKPISRVSSFKSIELLVALFVLMAIHRNLSDADGKVFFVSYLWGLIIFLLVHGLNVLLESPKIDNIKWLSSGFGMFLYLEVLDASFSFDGVIGAFAISHEIFVIMIGLSVGAFFVRGLTLYLVDNETLTQFEYLEHGAFYALGVLAFFMLLDPFFHFSEWFTALTGAFILALSIFWSIYVNRRNRTSHNH